MCRAVYPASSHLAKRRQQGGAISKKKSIRSTLGINEGEDWTIPQYGAYLTGQLGSFLVPYAGEEAILGKVITGAGKISSGIRALLTTEDALTGARELNLAGKALKPATILQTGGVQANQAREKINQQRAAGMDISPEQQLATQRANFAIGLLDLAPIERFAHPIAQMLTKVPAKYAPIAERIIANRLSRIAGGATLEGGQEVVSGILSDLTEKGVYNPDAPIGGDIFSNAAGGAFAGSLMEGIVQIASGRKLRGHRQLQADLETEKQKNSADLHKISIAEAAESLRASGVQGNVTIEPNETPEGFTVYTLMGLDKKPITDFHSQDDAVQAVDLYKQMTGATVNLDMTEPPKLSAIRIGNQKFPTLEAAAERHRKIKARINDLVKFGDNFELVSKMAAEKGFAPQVLAKQISDEIASTRRTLSMFDRYFSADAPVAKTKEEIKQGPKISGASVNSQEMPVEAPAPEPDVAEEPAVQEYQPEDFTDTFEAPTPITSEDNIPEMPIGAVEMPVEESRILPDSIVEEDAAKNKPAEAAPEAPITVEQRPSATADDLVALRTELFGKPIGWHDLTPEQMAIYNAERDKRYPPEDVSVYNSAGPLREPAPRNLREAHAVGPTVKDYTPETQAWLKNVYTQLQNRLDAIVPGQAKIELKTLVGANPNFLIRGQARTIDTQYGIKSIVDLSTGILRPGMSVEDAVKALVGTLNHEVVHVLRDKGVLRPEEWRILSRAAAKTNVQGKKYTYLEKAEAVYVPNGVPMDSVYSNPDAVVEEAVAEMYKDWVLKGQKPTQQVVGLFNRITEFLRRIFQVIRNARHKDIFKQIETGEVGGRQGEGRVAETRYQAGPVNAPVAGYQDENGVTVPGGTRFSAAPLVDSQEFKQWFGGSKLVDESGVPLKLYTGTSKDTIFQSFKDSDRGTWVTTDPKSASDYSLENDSMGLKQGPNWTYTKVNSASRVIPLYASVKNVLDLSTSELQDAYISSHNITEFGGSSGYQKTQAAVGRYAMREGYDAIQWAPNVWAIFNAKKNLKSQFNEFTDKSIASSRFSAAPLPPYIQQQNSTLFAPKVEVSTRDKIFGHFLDRNFVGKTLNTMHGQINISSLGMAGVAGKQAAIDKNAYITELEKLLNQKTTGNYQRMEANYSATAALAWRRRSSHIFASMLLRGNLEINFQTPGDIQSATMKVVDDTDSLKEIFNIITAKGPADLATGKQADKSDIFKSYAVARRGEWLMSTGQNVPREITPQYIRETTDFTTREYPEIIEAYNKYQRFNKKLLTTAKDAGIISQAELGRLTNQMNYYGFIYEAYGEALGPSSSQKTASKFKLRPYTGTQVGGLVTDPMFVMMQNSQFWVDSIAKNIAATKSFELLRTMGEARMLGTDEAPDELAGEAKDVMFFSQSGAVKRFAVKDPLLAASLGSDDRINVGKFWEALGLPSHILRESVTRDPAFMARNLLRDTVSAWITSGTDFMPVIDTLRGMKTALKDGASYKALGSYGVVGSYDLAMLGPAELAALLRKNSIPLNLHTVTTKEGATAALGSLWNRLGHVSEASDAATRIAVYDACIKNGMSEAEAAMQAIELLDFTRRGGSQTLGILTKLIPFLNARLQGMDVVYQAGRAGIRYATGNSLGERDANVGKKFLLRGGILALISTALEALNQGDDDYEQLDDYLKTSNLLIPLKEFGLKGQFLAIPKPFEAGLLFSTFPQQIYKTTTGEASARENAQLFWGQIQATLGMNPIPQFLLPSVEILTNHSFFTGLPLVSEGKARLDPALQYNTSTSQLAMMIGGLPIYYDFTTGKFGGMSPIVIDKLISGYGGPLGSYITQATSLAMEDAKVGPDRMPSELSNLPVVRSFFIDAKNKNPKVVTQAYELFRIADEANRTMSRLRQMGDAEALANYVDQHRDVLQYKTYIFALADHLNKLSAQERHIEQDNSMTADEKLTAQQKLREISIRLSSQVDQINKKLGR
jgi:hypothetical protein